MPQVWGSKRTFFPKLGSFWGLFYTNTACLLIIPVSSKSQKLFFKYSCNKFLAHFFILKKMGYWHCRCVFPSVCLSFTGNQHWLHILVNGLHFIVGNDQEMAHAKFQPPALKGSSREGVKVFMKIRILIALVEYFGKRSWWLEQRLRSNVLTQTLFVRQNEKKCTALCPSGVPFILLLT